MRVNESQQKEIEGSRAEVHQTRRVTVSAIEEMLYLPLPVLDHGFVRVVDYMGGDSSIVQAARVSFGRGTKSSRDDRGLINYLMRNAHTSPFEMCEIKLHVKLPIFVARQWIRHRTANVNEYSARYSILDNEFYIPAVGDIAGPSVSNRQGRERVLSEDEARSVQDLLREDALRAYEHYQDLLNEGPDGLGKDPTRTGIARELARMNLSLNFYTQWYWKIDLHNLLHFLQLRVDPHAQGEIRAYSEVILGVVQRWTPLAHQAFLEYRLEGVRLSRTAAAVLKKALTGESVTAEESGLSKSEWAELQSRFGL